MGQFKAEQWVPVGQKVVFAFFSDPNNLPKIMPPELRARVLFIDLAEPDGLCPSGMVAGAGTRITFNFRPLPFLPIRQKWVAEIIAYEYLSHFKDRQTKGPFKRWEHIHSFRSETRGETPGTLITDEVEFEVGYGFLGRIIENAISSRMQQTFKHRQAALEALLDPI